MKTFVHLRLKQYIEKHNIIVEKIAKEMKVNKGSLYNYFNGKTEIRLSILEKFVKINPTINIEWLLTGVGNMDHEVDNFAREDNDSYEKMCKKCEEYKMMIEDYRSHNKLLQENLDDCKYQLKKALNDSDRGRGGDTDKRKAG